ncbi:MAG: twin-arginine translocase TatA/TatE family subunit [Peptococcaceae bacterium]|jgi:Sec-independent protein translocase protein TatA|nr:twin-arginine translocase TatA/TatE family subunit [Peptococcaceae bacterium]
MNGTEIIVILVIGLVVFGPEELPGIARTVGKFVGELRQIGGELMGEFTAINPLKEVTDAIKEPLDAIKAPLKEVQTALEEPLKDIKNEINQADRTIADSIAASGQSPAAEKPADEKPAAEKKSLLAVVNNSGGQGQKEPETEAAADPLKKFLDDIDPYKF